ncbi:MAG TPA: amidase [Terriglobales bacterium]|nr:amidase [Terriglobales bacterium]
MPSATDLTAMTLHEASELVRKKSVSPVELTRACLERTAQLNPGLNAFITVTADSALEEARRAEHEIQHGEWKGPLHGIPISLKDLVDTAGVLTTAASAVFRERVPQEDAEIVRRLKVAGAVLVGKTNLHEFAYGGSGIIGAFPAARNPRNPELITGGSSSGSAATVAGELCYAAIGTDTAGSIRLPAACCGIVGLKPTYGRVSARGVIPLSWSYDHVGPMTRTVRDAALFLQAIAGYDPADLASQDVPVPDYSTAFNKQAVAKLRLGIPRAVFYENLDGEVAARIEAAISRLSALTAAVLEISLPVDSDRTVATCESWAYHAKYVASAANLYQPETLRRIRAGQDVTAADYIAKRHELELMRRQAGSIFHTVDLMITPTIPIPAPTFADLEAHPDQLRPKELMLLRNTRPFNVFGLPAISVPCGSTSDGRCVALQIAGKPWDEISVLRLAHAFEQQSA